MNDEDLIKSGLSSLSVLNGKKVLWTGYDEDMENFCAVAEGGQVLLFETVTTVTDGAKYISEYLERRRDSAKRVLDLDAVIAELTPKIEHKPEEEVKTDGEQQQPAAADGSSPSQAEAPTTVGT